MDDQFHLPLIVNDFARIPLYYCRVAVTGLRGYNYVPSLDGEIILKKTKEIIKSMLDPKCRGVVHGMTEIYGTFWIEKREQRDQEYSYASFLDTPFDISIATFNPVNKRVYTAKMYGCLPVTVPPEDLEIGKWARLDFIVRTATGWFSGMSNNEEVPAEYIGAGI